MPCSADVYRAVYDDRANYIWLLAVIHHDLHKLDRLPYSSSGGELNVVKENGAWLCVPL